MRRTAGAAAFVAVVLGAHLASADDAKPTSATDPGDPSATTPAATDPATAPAAPAAAPPAAGAPPAAAASPAIAPVAPTATGLPKTADPPTAIAGVATPPKKKDEPQEVRVRGDRGRPAGTTFGGQEVRQIPGAFGDAFRVMETLPGVTPIISGLPFFFVRGAPPGNNGYYLDGVRVPLLYHIGFGPSVIHPGLINKVDFYPGGYPARFGRYTGGILSGETRPPTTDGVHAQGNVRIFDAGALVEAPFANGRGTVLMGGRYSYSAAIISLAAPDARLDYWDYQARVTYKLGPNDTIGAFAFGSYDFLGEKKTKPDRTDTIFASQFHRLDLRWDHALPNRGNMRVAATIGTDSTSTEDLRAVRDRMVGVRMLVEQPVGKAVVVTTGVDAILDHYDLGPSENRGQNASMLYPPRNDIVAGAHLEANIRADERWIVTPGIRFDYFGTARSMKDALPNEQRNYKNAAVPAVDPRLTSRVLLGSRVSLVSSFALTHQPPAFFIPVPGLQIGRLSEGLQTGIQMSQGVEVRLPLGISFTPTFYYHQYLGLTDFSTTCGETSNETQDECTDRRVRGRTYGVEMLLRRSLTERLTGWISYTLSRTTRTTQVFLLGRDGYHDEIPGDFDRTHVLNVIGAYDLGHGWRAGARFFFYTGRPYSQRAFNFPVPPYNDQRMPDFHRFDARVEKAWRVGKGRISLVFEWLNVTLQKETNSVKCESAAGIDRRIPDVRRAQQGQVPVDLLDKCTFEEIGPITIPSIGVEGVF